VPLPWLLLQLLQPPLARLRQLLLCLQQRLLLWLQLPAQ
jgi:hypothetical protein